MTWWLWMLVGAGTLLVVEIGVIWLLVYCHLEEKRTGWNPSGYCQHCDKALTQAEYDSFGICCEECVRSTKGTARFGDDK